LLLDIMKVGFLLGSISREAGGLFQSVRGLAKAVRSENVTVRVFALRDKHSRIDAGEWGALTPHTFNSWFGEFRYSRQLRGTVVNADIDTLSIHGLWTYCSVVSRVWWQKNGRPYIVHPEGMLDSWALRNSRWKKRIAAFLFEDRHLRRAACLRALCDAEAHSIRAYGLRNPICVIPNGVDLPDLGQRTADDSLPITEVRRLTSGQRVLLYLGRLHPKKNLVALLEAWKESQGSEVRGQKSEEWVLAIAGWDQGGYEKELKRLARELGLQFSDVRGQSSAVRPPTSVAFLGPLYADGKDAAYRACDAVILPSLSEGLPMTVLEAWAYAKPALITPECNLPEGFAASAALQIGTSAREIARGLRQLIEMTDAERKTMGALGRTLAEEKFSWPRIGEQMRSVYEWMLGGGTPPETVRID
jgi:glycosyltransferase involved in cell wall biosynthesis